MDETVKMSLGGAGSKAGNKAGSVLANPGSSNAETLKIQMMTISMGGGCLSSHLVSSSCRHQR